ncbi:hypothetical protein [Exiguobacterium sp. s193]|uniref:hypothetical protein n=1 Tax=Exiguobacterium sp. s193 TaxID=2751207 RepID=UPI001BE8FCE4|nr:hypothetical protein [Exiguobacterium sp. s193]
MILRHYTERRLLPAIVARGGLSTNLYEPGQPGYLQFELNPETGQPNAADAVTLDFDFVKMQTAGIKVHEQMEVHAEKTGPVPSGRQVRYVQSFLSLGYLTEESREQLSEYY